MYEEDDVGSLNPYNDGNTKKHVLNSSSGYENSSPSQKPNFKKDLFERFDQIAEKREEEQKKRMDPNRDFVMKEGLQFL